LTRPARPLHSDSFPDALRALFFDNAAKANIKAMVELHYDDGTKELTEVKSRLGTSAAITQWP